MKKVLLLLSMVIAISCKNQSKKDGVAEIKKENFPTDLGLVFKAHGGIDTWRNAQILSFNKGEEVHTVDLYSRKTVVNTPSYSLGFDGKEVWLDEEKKGNYKGNPEFYYNLYFYFYAMPFVLADHGIIYEQVDDLIFKGVKYPGYKISYEANIGSSPDDTYIVYYNSNTYQMKWLAYTVTFESKTSNDDFHMIKYNKWVQFNELVLPKEITWYEIDEKGMPTKPAGEPVEFTLPLMIKGQLSNSFFEKPVAIQ